MSSINVTFMKRVTTGPYEHEEMKVDFTVDDRSQLEAHTRDMRNFVYRTLGKEAANYSPAIPPETTKTEGVDNGDNQEEGRKGQGKEDGSKKSRKSRKQETEVNTSAATEEMENVPSPYTASTSKPSEEEETKKEAPVEKKTKGKKDDGIVYDCDKDEHKSTLSNYLTKLTGGREWSKDKEKSRKISREVLHNQPFLAKDGSILESFKELCKENYGSAGAL